MFQGIKVYLVTVIGYSIIGLVKNYLQKKRISDPNYKDKITTKKRDEIQRRKQNDLLYQFMEIPITDNKKHIAKIAVSEIKKGEECMANKDYETATKHFANGLRLIDNKCQLICDLRDRVPITIYREIKDQFPQIHQFDEEMI